LLVVSYCVITRQTCPIGIGIVSCVFLCNTKEILWWGAWKPIFIIKHGEHMKSRKKVLDKRENHQNGRRRKRKGKFTYVKV
jgi:hypothetical protein